MNRNRLVLLTAIATALLPAFCRAQSYTITTVAGGANPYFYSGTGDGNPATSAGLANPTYGAAVDSAGNLYIATGTLIRKVSLNGVISAFAGGGSILDDGVKATEAALAPLAIAADSAGNVYIADTAFGMSRIRMVATNNVITTLAGGAECCVLGDGGLAMRAYIGVPYGLAVGGGNLYIAQVDRDNNLIRRVSAGGAIATVAGGGSNLGDGELATSASLSGPMGVAVDAAGNLYIAETNANRIRKVGTNGVIATVAGDGSATDSGDGGIATRAGVGSPRSVAVDSAGNLYIAQMNNARVRLVTSGGTIYTIAGDGTPGYSGDGGPSTSAMLDLPAGITIGGRGQVYVADAGSPIARVRLLAPPSLSITSTHVGNFAQGQVAAVYTVTVSNTASAGTAGTVTVTDILPAGLTADAIGGSGWTCTLASVSCTRNDILNGGVSWPGIAVTVNVLGNAGSPQVNSVSVSGGGSASANATDSTTIVPAGHPAFFAGEDGLGSGIYYLQFPDGSLFGYYGYLANGFIFHLDMGYEYVEPAGTDPAVYLWDLSSGHWFYTSPSLFPYLYDFTLSAWLYYFPATSPGHYTTDPRYFVNLTTSQIFTM